MKDYKKILEGVVNIINTTEKSDIGFFNICTYIGENCPELKESDNERIKKNCIHFLELQKTHHAATFEIDECIAWLEKQGEHANFRSKIQIGDKVTRNDSGVLVNLSQFERVAKKAEKQEQKPVEWSEEDEKISTAIIKRIKGESDALSVSLSSAIGWIGKVKDRVIPQPKQEWSEEDVKTLAKMMFAFKTMVLPSAEECNNFIEFLKNIRDKGSLQSTWKPSKEQIIALRWILNNIPYCSHKEEISGLLDQIKKLREE